jgi:multiple sugar transport system permease protein
VGFANYVDLFHDAVARRSFAVTVVFVTVSTALELLIGLCIALLMHRYSRGRGVFRACMLIPWAIPTVVAAQMWRFLFNDAYGAVNAVIFGTAVQDYIPWLARPVTALGALIVADVWKTSSFAALLILAGLQTIPDELYQAAAVDGAGPRQRFFGLTLPLIRPALLVALLFRTIDAFRVFDLAFVMTQGGPADATNVIQLYGYRRLFVEGMVGSGSALAVVVFLVILILALGYVTLTGRRLLEAR